MKKTRRRYDRAFKISVVAELESGKSLAQIAHEHSGIPGQSAECRIYNSSQNFTKPHAMSSLAG